MKSRSFFSAGRAVVTLVSSTSTSSVGKKSPVRHLIDLSLILIDLIEITVEMGFSSPFMITSAVIFGLEPVLVNNELC